MNAYNIHRRFSGNYSRSHLVTGASSLEKEREPHIHCCDHIAYRSGKRIYHTFGKSFLPFRQVCGLLQWSFVKPLATVDFAVIVTSQTNVNKADCCRRVLFGSVIANKLINIAGG